MPISGQIKKERQMKKISAVIATLALLSACSGAPKADEKTATGAEPTASATKASDVKVADAKGGTTSGVAECDDYVSKIQACMNDKMPAAQRGAMEQSLNQAKAQWATISDKAALAQSCKTMTESAKAAYKAVGCDF